MKRQWGRGFEVGLKNWGRGDEAAIIFKESVSAVIFEQSGIKCSEPM
jgi:hypothetical protein